jgi:hypothetical protein
MKTLIEKVPTLPAERAAEIEDFTDFIRVREQERSPAAAAASASAAIWSNPEDDVYEPGGRRSSSSFSGV